MLPALNLTFLATYTSYSLRLGHAAVDRAVERAVDLARTLLSGAQGPGPRAEDPIGP